VRGGGGAEEAGEVEEAVAGEMELALMAQAGGLHPPLSPPSSHPPYFDSSPSCCSFSRRYHSQAWK